MGNTLFYYPPFPCYCGPTFILGLSVWVLSVVDKVTVEQDFSLSVQFSTASNHVTNVLQDCISDPRTYFRTDQSFPPPPLVLQP
jgi:hypothetical protein